MSFSIIYLLRRFIYRIARFVYDWYVGGFLLIGSKCIGALEALDRALAFRINLQNIFKPLYQDQSIIGRGLGFLLRCGRLIVAAIIYAFIILIAGAIYVFWAGIPLYIIDQGFFY